MTPEELDLLLAQDPTIPRETWGIKDAKTQADLFDEIEEGVATLAVEYIPDTLRDGIVRDTCVLLLAVYFEIAANMRLMLVEMKHVLASGYTFTRVDEMNASATEKVRKGETRDEAVLRLLAEELQILELTDAEKQSIHFFDAPGFRMTDVREPEKLRRSWSYPGLWTRQRVIHASITLSPRHYRPEGYVERVHDKRGRFVKEIHFAWMTEREARDFASIMRTAKGISEGRVVQVLLSNLDDFVKYRKKNDP